MPESLQELLGGRLARLPGETLDVLLEVAALARPTVDLVAAAYGDEERVIEALEAAVREGVVELDGSRSASPIPCSPRSATSGPDLEATRRPQRARLGSLGHRGARAPSRPRRGRSRRRNRLGAGCRRRAGSRTWGADRGGRALRAGCRADPGRSRARATAALAGGEPSTASPETPSGRSPRSSSCSRRFRPAPSARTCSSLASGRSTRTRATLIELADEALVRGGGRRRALVADPWPPGLAPLVTRRSPLGPDRRPPGSRAGRACRRPGADRPGDRAGGPGGNLGSRDYSRLARARRRDGRAPRAPTRLTVGARVSLARLRCAWARSSDPVRCSRSSERRVDRERRRGHARDGPLVP